MYEFSEKGFSEYFSVKETKEILKVTSKTLREWDKKSKIRTTRHTSGQRMYYKEDVYNIAGINIPIKNKQKIAYCRVSSQKQIDDLERQKNFFRTEYPDYKLVTDIGSGINWKRKGFKTLLELAMSDSLEEVMVAHRDRLCRFAFELIEYIFKIKDVKLTVLYGDSHSFGKATETELANDILSIIHVYSCREMGKRRYCRNQNQEIENLPKQSTKKNTERMDVDKQICLQ